MFFLATIDFKWLDHYTVKHCMKVEELIMAEEQARSWINEDIYFCTLILFLQNKFYLSKSLI